MRKILLLVTTLIAFAPVMAQDNNALKITPGTSYFWCPTFFDFVTTEVTFEAWVKLDTGRTVNDYTAVADGRYGGKNLSKALIFKTNTAGQLTLGFEWEGAWDFLDEDGLNEVIQGEWQHVAVVVSGDDGTATFYVNGVEGVVFVPPGTEPNEYGNIGADIYWDTLFIAAGNTDPGRTVIGLIDEIRVWNVARTEEEILANMTYEIIEPDALDLLAYYRCNEEPGETILTDYSGNENHGVIFGTDTNLTFVTDNSWIIVPEPEAVDEYKLNNVSIYPNPVTDIIHFKGVDVTNSEIKIFNIMGQLLIKTVVRNSSLDIGYLKSGVYFIEMTKDNQKTYTKIIKQ